MKQLVVFSLFVIVLASCNAPQKKVMIPPGELDIQSMIQPIPVTAKFINDTSYIWCGTLVKSHIDKKYHLFYSRWPREYGFSAWVTSSEVAHAVSDSPFGPFQFKDVTLPHRGAEYWDGMYTHNPTVHFFNGKYYLYYAGNFGDGKITSPQLNWTHRNNQRIGVAIADNPNGPWKRFDKSIIDISADTTAHDAQMVANPSVTQMPDGRFLMVYKAVARKKPQPFGGPVVHLTAIADKPEGPFIKQNKPVFTAENVDFPAEDPFVWYQDNCYYAIVKDMKGAFTNAGRSLVLFYSLDGLDWKLAKHPLVSDLNIKWADGTTQKLEALERPQLFFENGKMVALLCAVNETLGHSYNVQIPLKLKLENEATAADLQAKALKQDQLKEGSSNSHPLAQWFPEAGLGLFIHWGMASVNATGDLSWCMLANKPWKDATITPNNYYAQANRWNPDKMDYNKMLKKAKDAGVTYAVMVTKHHDGFTLWPSAFSDMGTKKSLGGRDFVKEFVTACRKNNIRVGLYYSPPDWWFERKYKSFSYKGPALDMDHKPVVLPDKPADYEQKRKEHVQKQVRELLTNYGKIDLIWFDGGKGEISNEEVRQLQPGIVVNRRNGGGGDYGDSEGKLPEKRFSGWFETCETCWPSNKWSYTEDFGWDTAPQVISELVKLRAWGGNLLANVGPKADGSVPEKALSAWKEMAAWMKFNRESVIGTTGGPWPEKVNVPVTMKKGVAYLHFLPEMNEELIWRNAPEPAKVFLLKNNKPIPFNYQNGTLKIKLTADQRSNNDDVIKLMFKK
jgi:alpha-L-fucosidase